MCSRVTNILSSTIKILRLTQSSYTCRILEPSVKAQRRNFSSDNASTTLKKDEETETKEHNLSSALSQQFQKFRDEDSEIIFDVDEERRKIDLEMINAVQEVHDPYKGLNMKRGLRGVYDIEDLVELLKQEKARDIFVAAVPTEMTYVDYIVIMSSKSVKHMSAIAHIVRKVYKLKCNSNDILPKIEGINSTEWVAMDLGNIALHIFSPPTRRAYDLETLWTVGAEYDPESNKLDPEKEFEEKYKKFLEGLQPADE